MSRAPTAGEIHECEELARVLLESSADCIAIIDADGRVVHINERGLRALAREGLEVRPSQLWEGLWATASRAAAHRALAAARAGQASRFESHSASIQNVSPKWEVTLQPLRDRAGKVGRVLAIAREAGEAGPGELAGASREPLQFAVEAASAGTWSWDLRTGALTMSDMGCSLFGFPPGMPLSYDRVLEGIHPDDRARVDEAVRAAVRCRTEYDREFRIMWPDGNVRWMVSRGRAHYDQTGRPLRFEGVTLDITRRKLAEEARKRTEAALAEREAQLALAIEHCPAPIALLDHEMRYLASSRRWLSTFRLQGPVVGRNHYEVLTNVPQRWREVYQRCLAGAVERSEDDVYVRPDGSVDWLRWEVRPWRTAQGEVGGIVIFAEVITERKRAEEELRLSEERLRLAIAGGSLGTWHWDFRSGRLLWSDLSFAMFGLTPRPNLTFDDFRAAVHPEDRSRIDRAVERSVRERRDYDIELRACWPDGSIHWLAARGKVFYDASGAPQRMEGIAQDITPRKRTEQALREGEQRFRDLAEAVPHLIWQLDPDGRLIYANRRWSDYFGRSSLELHQWQEVIHPDDLARVSAVFGDMLRTELDIEPFRLRRYDGVYQWFSCRSVPVRDDRGRLLHVVGTSTDVTQHKRLEDALRQSQKMEAIGRLAGGVAHDFNNLLTVILGQASLVALQPALPPGVRRALDDITGAAERAASLTSQLLAFGRRKALEARPLDLNQVVASISEMLRRLLGENITLQIDPSTPPPHLQADSNMLAQVVLNLALNARDAMPQGGRLTIRTTREEFDEPYPPAMPEARAGSWACLSVSDTGSGIPQEFLPRIFEPFFTTKDVGKGTGLGLATVYGIVQQHQGWISVDSTPGKGSTFKVYLPLLKTESEPHIASSPELPAHGHGERVLLVEDEAAVRSVVERILADHGYHVTVVENGAQALEAFAAHGSEIDLLLTDIVMSGLSGLELALRLRVERPDLKVILCTGYSADRVDHDLRGLEQAALLQKPYRTEQLLSLVRRVLGDKDTAQQ